LPNPSKDRQIRQSGKWKLQLLHESAPCAAQGPSRFSGDITTDYPNSQGCMHVPTQMNEKGARYTFWGIKR
jgi:hypothetical protein